MTRVAFIGLGTMGLPMARNLLAAGHAVVAVDSDPDRTRLLDAPAAATPAEAAEASEVGILSLPSQAAVKEVVFGRLGLRDGAPPGFAVIDMSTGPPALARRLADELGRAGMGCLDAPVSGGPRGAEAGTLTIMVGGTAEAFVSQRSLLEKLGTLVVHVGGRVPARRRSSATTSSPERPWLRSPKPAPSLPGNASPLLSSTTC